MAEWTEARELVALIMDRHISEYGKVLQKLLALTMLKAGYGFCEERSIEGVDIDVIDRVTEERHSFEVKTSRSNRVTLAKKDFDGLKSRRESGFETFFAVLCAPSCFCNGWIVCPSVRLKVGQHTASGLVRKRDAVLSERVNSLFPEVIEEIGPGILACRPGAAMAYMKREHGI